MSDDAIKRKTALALRPTSYEVGYGKPPAHSRFQAGRSGNPKGRPRGSRNRLPPSGPTEDRLQAIILTIPMAQAVVRSLAVSAAKGSQRAQRLFTQLLAATERDKRTLRVQELEAALTYKVAWERELERRKRMGIVAPDPLPHPDHLVIGIAAGTVRIEGPATREEQVLWAVWSEQLRLLEEELGELEAYVEAAIRRKRSWRAIAAWAGLQGVRIHDLRHSFASIGAFGGISLPIVGKVLTQATTARYAHLDSEQILEHDRGPFLKDQARRLCRAS